MTLRCSKITVRGEMLRFLRDRPNFKTRNMETAKATYDGKITCSSGIDVIMVFEEKSVNVYA